jgi:hypothetical protein
MENKKWKRDDLVKYKAESTKPITFRCDKEFTGTGTQAREILKSLFRTLISLIENPREKLKDYLNEIEDVNKILALDIMKKED